jgi:hypothetical protein
MASLSRLLALAGTAAFISLPAAAVDLFNNTNTGGVQNGASVPTWINATPVHVGQLETYHWNNGRGATPGSITIKSLGGQSYGPFKATGSAGQGGAPNVNWVANVDVTLPLGTYQIIDSDPTTWSQNAQTRGIGFAIVRGDRVAAGTPVPPPPQPTVSRLPPPAVPPAAPVPAPVPVVKAPILPVPAAPAAPAAPVGSDLFNNTNTGEVQNNATGEVLYLVAGTVHVTQLQTYHWNGGKGAKPGTLTLKSLSGPTYGPFPAKGAASGNVANANWLADVNLTLTTGTYQVIDSDPATWSQNAQTHGVGFAIIRGTRVTPTPAAPPAPAPTAPVAGAPSGGTYKACMSNAGAIATIGTCSGAPGTKITFQLTRKITSPITKLTFKPYLASGVPGATAVQFVSNVSGNSTAQGAFYEVDAPQGLCVGGKSGSWDLFPFDATGAGQGDIGRFSVICGAGAVVGGGGAPAPTVTPPPAAATPAPFKPCFVNAGSVASVSPCTTIHPGDIVTIELSKALTAPIKTVSFKPYQANLPSATAAQINVTMTTSAKNAGGTYSFPLPTQICVGGKSASWDVWPTDANNKGLGDIGRVNVVCK